MLGVGGMFCRHWSWRIGSFLVKNAAIVCTISCMCFLALAYQSNLSRHWDAQRFTARSLCSKSVNCDDNPGNGGSSVRLLVVFRVPAYAIDARELIRRKTGASYRECRVESVFLYGRFSHMGNSNASQHYQWQIAREKESHCDILQFSTVLVSFYWRTITVNTHNCAIMGLTTLVEKYWLII